MIIMLLARIWLSLEGKSWFIMPTKVYKIEPWEKQMLKRCHDNQHNDMKHNNTQHYDTQQKDTQQYGLYKQLAGNFYSFKY